MKERYIIAGRSPATGARMYYTSAKTFATRGHSQKFASVEHAFKRARKLLAEHPQLRAYGLFAERLKPPQVKKNPSAYSNLREKYARELDAQDEKLAAFTGERATHVTRYKKPPVKAAFALGKLCAVEYRATRDGVSDLYRHDFRKSSQPLLVSDGSQLDIVGGRIRVTERGIEDT